MFVLTVVAPSAFVSMVLMLSRPCNFLLFILLMNVSPLSLVLRDKESLFSRSCYINDSELQVSSQHSARYLPRDPSL